MKDMIIFQGGQAPAERELKALTYKIEGLRGQTKELEDLEFNKKGLKVFQGRLCPDLKFKLPNINRKLKKLVGFSGFSSRQFHSFVSA